MQKEMKSKIDHVTFAKRRLEMMQYDIMNVLKTVDPREWTPQITSILNKYSGPKLDGKASNLFKQTKLQEENNEDSGSDSEVEKVKEELLRQRNWLSQKLKKMNKSKKSYEFEKIKAQSENLRQINELRHDNQSLTKRVQILEKKFKDLWGK
jgi:hypothetical protein